MFHFATPTLTHLLITYGYWAVLLFAAIESTGIPFPGETMLLVAVIYAGISHCLPLPLITAAAASGAILGDNLGFWIGREGGYRLLRHYGRYIGLDRHKLKLSGASAKYGTEFEMSQMPSEDDSQHYKSGMNLPDAPLSGAFAKFVVE